MVYMQWNVVSSDAVNVQQYRTSRHGVTSGNEIYLLLDFGRKHHKQVKSSVETLMDMIILVLSKQQVGYIIIA
jgi:hypothetical protein